MLALLNWRVWVAIGIATSIALAGWKGYDIGKQSVQAEFDIYRAEQVAQALKAEEVNRAKEQGMHTSLENLTNAYIKNQKANSASAVAAGNSLRDLQAALGSATAIDPSAPGRADDLARARFVVGDCATTIQKMADAFDTSEERLRALQEYVKSLVLKP
jgi:DNA repair ATPase RecN